ncbi:substrate-binding domain-containing protein [bacterium]|nr:substrate-binding domain-containing protein [bacterium]
MITLSVTLTRSKDIGLVDYDDIPFSSLISPALTTIKLKKQELGVESVKLLFSRINGSRKKMKKIMLDVELISRET